MRLNEIEGEMRMLSQPKLTGADAAVVRQLKKSLFHARMLVGLAAVAIVVKGGLAILTLDELPTGMRGQFIVSQLLPVLILIAAYAVARLVLSNLHLRHGERDFDVKVEER